jgi:hypothetical protein
MSRNHPTLAHMVRDAERECIGQCRQGRPSAGACLHPKTCRTFVDEQALYSHTHRVTPVQPDDAVSPVLHFLDAWLTNFNLLAIGGIAAGLVAGVFLIVYILTNHFDLVALVARMHKP